VVGPRHTARGIVVRDSQLLLMERWRPGKHYFSVPGGGIEPGETPEQTVEREILEETGLTVTVDRLVFEMRDGERRHSFYLCTYLDGEPFLPPDSPEAKINTEDNKFVPGWQPVNALPDLPFTYWAPIKAALVKGLSSGFSVQPTIVTAAEKS
jgi:8-oxo-dGTP diphosphatase